MKVTVKAYQLALSRLAMLCLASLKKSSYTYPDHESYYSWRAYW
ncbi:hypothetical protein PMIN01_04955 [Paraphaeosphaeria minitans]|uniref:Uncharacterized protein n=1 Tax=Paraphaeosphaeria minitans TaxID=565426 RepID=A0A9P6GL00_9PLEO|nr:hypothetical protein PMIN01_04955 [Paraphaeosphaeria minitans]